MASFWKCFGSCSPSLSWYMSVLPSIMTDVFSSIFAKERTGKALNSERMISMLNPMHYPSLHLEKWNFSLIRDQAVGTYKICADHDDNRLCNTWKDILPKALLAKSFASFINFRPKTLLSGLLRKEILIEIQYGFLQTTQRIKTVGEKRSFTGTVYLLTRADSWTRVLWKWIRHSGRSSRIMQKFNMVCHFYIGFCLITIEKKSLIAAIKEESHSPSSRN